MPTRPRKPPRRTLRRPKAKPSPIVAMTGYVLVEPDHPVPLVLIVQGDHLDQMAADRLIASTGLKSWVREVRPDDAPDTSKAIDPSPDALEEAEGLAASMGSATHVVVTVLATGVRSRFPITVLSAAELN